MPWIDADEWLDLILRRAGVGGQRMDPLNFAEAETLARITGPYQYEHHSDGTTRILVDDVAKGTLIGTLGVLERHFGM